MILINKLLSSPEAIWSSSTKVILDSNAQHKLPSPWQLMLLGDGSPTRHLQLITGNEVAVELIAMESVPEADQRAPKEVAELEKPLLKRQVWLKCGEDTLAWAESWWNLVQADKHLQNKDQPIWQSLTKDRYELFREVDGLEIVEADWLQSKFEEEGPFWSRHYRFFRNQQELTVIREVFNPKLEQWLGPIKKERI